MRLLVVVLVVVAAMPVAAYSYSTATRIGGTDARVKPLRLRERCVTKAERSRVVRFRAADRVRLIGVMVGRGPRGVVLAHQGGGAPPNLCSWIPYARQLARAGFRVLAFDHRNSGSSARVGSPTRAWRVDLDVRGAVAELRRRGATSVVLGGASLGGTAVLAAAAHIAPAVNGVVSFSAPAQFVNVDALAAVRASSVPSLFVSAEADEDFADAARRFFDASPARDKRLEIVPGGRHGAPLLRDPGLRTLVTEWIRAHSN